MGTWRGSINASDDRPRSAMRHPCCRVETAVPSAHSSAQREFSCDTQRAVDKGVTDRSWRRKQAASSTSFPGHRGQRAAVALLLLAWRQIAPQQGRTMNLYEAPSGAGKSAVPRQGGTFRQRLRSRPAHASARRAASDPCSRLLQARGPRGELRFRLQYHQGGLYVEREEIPSHGLHVVQSMHFREVRQFERWCEGDPARFEHPLLHLALKRDAEALWQLREPSDG